MQDTEVGMKISTNLTCSMWEKVFMALGEVYIGLVPSLIPPIIRVIMADNLVFIFTVITEVEIGITPANFLHIPMVD